MLLLNINTQYMQYKNISDTCYLRYGEGIAEILLYVKRSDTKESTLMRRGRRVLKDAGFTGTFDTSYSHGFFDTKIKAAFVLSLHVEGHLQWP